MAPTTRYDCFTYKRSIIKDFLIQENEEYVCHLFCEVISKISDTLEIMDTRIAKLEAINKSIDLEKDVGDR